MPRTPEWTWTIIVPHTTQGRAEISGTGRDQLQRTLSREITLAADEGHNTITVKFERRRTAS